MSSSAKPRKVALAIWLLVFPALLVAAVFALPRFSQLHGTAAERYTLLALMVLPVAGVVGILRHLRSSLGVRLALAVGYLAGGLAFALFAVVFIGCSWAGACF